MLNSPRDRKLRVIGTVLKTSSLTLILNRFRVRLKLRTRCGYRANVSNLRNPGRQQVEQDLSLSLANLVIPIACSVGCFCCLGIMVTDW